MKGNTMSDYGKDSRRRPEDASAIARRWPFRKPADKDVEGVLRWMNKATGPTPTIYAPMETILRLRKGVSRMGKCKGKGGGKKK